MQRSPMRWLVTIPPVPRRTLSPPSWPMREGVVCITGSAILPATATRTRSFRLILGMPVRADRERSVAVLLAILPPIGRGPAKPDRTLRRRGGKLDFVPKAPIQLGLDRHDQGMRGDDVQDGERKAVLRQIPEQLGS